MAETHTRVDLHCHSSASNGATGKPADIARLLKNAGFAVFALAEHDRLASRDAAATSAAAVGIEFVPGVVAGGAGPHLNTRSKRTCPDDRPTAHNQTS